MESSCFIWSWFIWTCHFICIYFKGFNISNFMWFNLLHYIIQIHKQKPQKNVKWTKFMVELFLIGFHAHWLSYPLSFTISLPEIKLSELTVELCFLWGRLLNSTQEIILFKFNCFILAFFTFIVGKCNVFPFTCHVGVNICLIIAFFESTYEKHNY